MNLPLLAAKNVLRNKFRTVLTITGVAIAILAFILLRTILTAWNSSADAAAKDRLATRNKISFVVALPYKYVRTIAETPGVKAVTYANWFGGKDAAHDKEFFATLAIDHTTALEVYDEMIVPADQAQAWKEDMQGALVGDVLARKMGWTIGSKVTLLGTIYPKPAQGRNGADNWEFTVRGIYTATKKSIDRTQFLFHWDYLDKSLPEARQGHVGWVVIRVDDPGMGAEVTKAIDDQFKGADVETFTQSERALTLSFLAMFGAILRAIDVVSMVILLIMMLILGNTIAMGVRERTNEYGTLRAIGFLPRHVAAFIMGEALTIGALGAALGLLISYPIVTIGAKTFIEENLGGIIPTFEVKPVTYALAIGFSFLLAAIAAALPAWRASKLSVTDALRRVG